MNLHQTLQQTDLPRLAACAAHRHVASQAGRETVETFLRSLCALEPVRSDGSVTPSSFRILSGCSRCSFDGESGRI